MRSSSMKFLDLRRIKRHHLEDLESQHAQKLLINTIEI